MVLQCYHRSLAVLLLAGRALGTKPVASPVGANQRRVVTGAVIRRVARFAYPDRTFIVVPAANHALTRWVVTSI